MKLYKYSSIDKYLLLNLQRNEIYFNIVNKVNDPYEGMMDLKVKSEIEDDFLKFFYCENYDKEVLSKYTFDELKREIIFYNVNIFLKEAGISCFSETNKSLVMWGHYASNHNGICIEFDSTIGIFKHAKKVEYTRAIHTVSVNSKNNLTEDFFMTATPKCMYKKYEQWKYEKEWRIIFESNKGFEYPPKAITGIYFGMRTTDEDIELVHKATKHLEHLNYFKATLKPHEYKIVYNPILFNR
jgi:hypothetical protein